MSTKLVRPFKLTLTDAQGVVIEQWTLSTRSEDPQGAWLQDDGELSAGGQMVLCAELAVELRRAAKNV